MLKQEATLDAAGAERRKRQRFVATRWGNVCFWVEVDGVRLPVNDLSLEGFSLPWGAPLAEPRVLDFTLEREGIAERIRGRAQTIDFIVGAAGGLLGCRFLSFSGDGAARLHEWLTLHVISTATLHITESEAGSIVSGPSLV